MSAAWCRGGSPLDERDLLQLAAGRAAVAIQHAALYEQRRLADALQRRLLPDLRRRRRTRAGRPLPAGERCEPRRRLVRRVPARRRPHRRRRGRRGRSRRRRGGGDGAAADGAARVRGGRGRARPPWWSASTRFIHDLGPPTMTTLAYVVIDPERESLEAVIAGHPPPLMIPREGAPSFLPLQGGIPLGASPLARYRSDTHPFRAGDAIVLYTDGLVETRGESIDDGLARLRRARRGGARPGGAVRAARRRAGARRARGRRRRPRRAGPAAAGAPARSLAGRRAGARRPCGSALRRWLRAQGATDDETADITVACQEACTNAVEHAYGPGARSFTVEATCHDGPVRITVRDEGSWRPPRGANRGRGLTMMRAADALAWTSGTPTRAPSSCSSARWRGRPHEPAGARASTSTSASSRSPRSRARSTPRTPRDLGERLRAALTNRSLALIVDLSGTTYLDSAGITLLFALDAELQERRQRLHLVVPAGVADRARARDRGARRRHARPRDPCGRDRAGGGRRRLRRVEGYESLRPRSGTTGGEYEMADRVQHQRSIPAATFGPYSYGFSYRTWRFS